MLNPDFTGVILKSDQSSSVQPNAEKKIPKNPKKISKILKNLKKSNKKKILLNDKKNVNLAHKKCNPFSFPILGNPCV